MNPKAQTFAQLATNTSGQLTSSYAEWTHFLETAARLYKYPYHEQILIYAQRPEATACASFDVWNRRMNRGVRRGSKGIGLLSADGVRYVFDISDTFGRDGSRRPYLWEYQEEHAEAVTAALADKYGVTDEGGLPYQLEAIAQELAGEYWEQNWEDILASVPGSFLEDYDEVNVEVEFRNAVTVSTTYALMSRCGLNPGEFFTHEDFLPVFDFNTPDSITALGTAVSGNSEQVLRQIEVVVKNYERTRRTERRELYGEQSQLSAGGGLSAARIRGGNTIDFGEIRTDEGAVSERGAPGTVQPAASQREADGAPDGDRADGQPEVGAADAGAEEVHGPDGTDEGQRPHEVGGPDEQREGEGGGDDSGGTDLPVTPPAIDFTAVGPTGLQFSHRELNPAVIPYFEDVSEKRELLIKSDALKKRRVEVAEYFAAHSALDERILFVKSLFNNTYTEIILDSGQRVGYRAYDDVLHLWRGPYTDREQEEYLRWEDTVSAIEGMMQDGIWTEQAEPLEQLTLEIDVPDKDVQEDDYVPNLFDLAGSTIPLTNEPVEGAAPIRPLLSQNVIDAALTLGANDQASRLRIIAEFMKDKPLEENARFLQVHYKENGAGFYIGERKYSLWYNEAGMQIAPGKSALTFTATALTWEQAAERIRELLDEGKYASQAMLYRAWPFEKNRVAEALQYLHRDIDEEYKDKYLPTLTAAIGGAYIYPAVVDKTKELLEQPEQLKSVIDEFTAFQKDYAHNRGILRFKHRPDEIMQGLQDLQCAPIKFTASPDYTPVERFFISQDEIDDLLREDNDRKDYRIKVYNFFEQHPDRKEREKYLSHLHGEYSGYHGGNNNITYTYKELTFTHGDIIEPYAAVKMKWPQVRKRIEELIKKDKFLSTEDREVMENRTLEIPSEEIDPLETAKMLIHKFRQSDRTSLDFSDLSKVLLTNAITENEKHGIQVFADLNNHRLLFEVNTQTVSTLQYHDLNDLNEHLEKLSASELIDFAKEQYVINLKNDAPTKISEQDAKKHDILMENTKAHFASYEEVKQAHPGDIVLFQRGDFFEMYGPDARVASVELDIHLTNRNIPEFGRVAMCGVPANSLERYVEILRKEHGVTISVVPENGAERQTYYFSSYKDVPKVSLAPPSSDSLDQASEQNLIATPQMVPSIDEYARIKGQFPGYVVGVQNGDTLYFYGTDAEKAGPALNRNVLIRDIPGMGAVSITGDAESWQASKEKLLRKGIDLTFVRLDDTGKYEIIITSTAAEYIPVGMELDIDGRRCRIESVDFQQDAVHLTVPDSGYSLTESVRYVREYVEEAYDKELEKAAEEEKSRLFVEHVMEDVEQLAEQEQAPTVRELYAHYKEIIWGKLMEDEAYRNACLHSDRQNAMGEGRNAVERAAKDLGIAQEDMQFYKLYYGNTPFHNRLNEELATEGYDAYIAMSAELPPWGVQVGDHSPWGAVQTTQELAEGVFKVSTPSHGGIMLWETLAKEYLSPELLARGGNENGWCFFEEDELAPQVFDELTQKSIVADPNREPSLPDSITSPSKQEEKRPGQTRPERNYRSFTRLFPEIADGSYHYLRMESGSGIGGMMPLHVEWISDDTVSISHTYTQNGDLMHDPEMTFLIDRDKGTMEAASYQQDSLGIYQNVYPEPGRWVPELRKDLNNFAQQWLKNISEQSYVKREAIVVENGEDVTLEFDSEGTLIQSKQLPDEPRDPLAPAYKVGDTVYLDKTAFTITKIGLYDVQLQDPTLLYPVCRSENKETFEKLLRRDERNLFITDYLTYTRNGPIDDGGDLRDALCSEGGLLNEQSKNEVSEWLCSGEGNAAIAQRLQKKFDGTSETMTLETGETADYSIYGDRFMLSLLDKSHTVRMYDLWMVAGVLRDMYQRELGGFTHATVPKQYTPQTTRYIVVSDEFGEENRPFTIWDSWNRLHYAEVGDTVNSFDTREEAQTYADTLNSRMYVSKPVAIYPAEKNNLPFDVVVEKLHIEHSERQTEQESTADSKLFPAAQEFSVGDIIQIGKDIPEYRVLYTKKTVLDINSLPVTMYGFSAYWDRELQHLKFIDTATLPSREEIRVIGRANDVSVGEKANNQPDKSGNFHITDDNLGAGGAKAKYQMNMAALKTLHDIELENRAATPEEQAVLSKYVGWGALADAFDESKPDWTAEYKELRETLTPEEYESARASTLNAHYTSPTVIKAIYQALENMGFKGGNILEPSCGVGNFFGLLPDSMSESRLYGVELDGLTGRIAKQLYPNAHIEIKGYENTTFQNNSFDLAIGNVPFGQYQVFDPAYNKLGFSIHNYFFAKTIDQVRPGGIIAFVTSRYTMDSKSTDAREYIAQRAELLGAIRLPNNAFLSNAGTEVVSDILFLQKREQPITELPDWTQTEDNKDGYTINSYFIRHPEMVLGIETSDSTRYGQDYTVAPHPDIALDEQLKEAISHIEGRYVEAETVSLEEEKEQETIPADPEVKNFSYTIIKGDVYYRQDSVMVKMELGATAKARITALIDLRDCTRRLIAEQMELSTRDEDIRSTQAELNRLYDNFSRKFGLINDKTNERAFSDDSSYYLLCALEILDDDGKFVRKADMFTKRTILPRQEITHVDTATEALEVSIGERARVDIPFMAGLTGKTEEDIISELQGQIFRVPFREPPLYQTADEYLSGNVREKLSVAEVVAEDDPVFNINVNALAAVQPKDLDASEISVRLGTDWIDSEYVEQFMYELLKTPGYAREYIHVQYSSTIHAWNISSKRLIRENDVTAYTTYGTSRVSAYKLLEDALNLQNTRVFDTKTIDGEDKRILNAKETTLAQQKQDMIKYAFQDWIWKDPERRQKLVRKYNDEMNCIRPRQYDGSHLVLAGMNPEIQLEEHQKNAIARAVYGGNTLFAHCVGAGKTFEITASAMEMKRLGLCSKSMIVVPNHLTGQWASEFLRLYPNANILVTTRRDFEKDRRKKFCSRIATGDYDAVIIGYSQFEKIPISKERQIRQLNQQMDAIIDGIARAKAEDGQRFTVKSMERTKRSLEARLKKLRADNRKDSVIDFEELGIDRLFVDESDNFKNLFLVTKMQNVAGLSTSDAQKSSDMFSKTQYLDEITDYKGVIFATGTPISNSITEMFTVQRYLQSNALKAMGMEHFDSWASRFGETTTTMELAPEGTGYRPRERFAKFFNLPELMNIFHEVADIKTEDMLNLPTPDVEFHNIVAKPTEFQKAYVQELSERATAVRIGDVEPTEDNLLKITNDGRKLGLDQRLISPFAEDAPDSKLNLCVDNIMRFWEDGKEDKLTQLVFSDLSTPKKDGSFNVYDDIKRKLVERGVPETEVAFIHDADTEVKKKELFAKVRSGKVRVLIGSTQKLGAGTNVQDRLIALHHLDCPWRPRDLTQREGRIIRRGNNNPLVHVFRYVTEATFDSYLFQTVEKKQQFIGQIMTSKSPARTCEDVDEAALSYAEVKALCAGDPRIKERMELDVEVAKLQIMQASHRSQQYDLEDKIRLYFPQERQRLEWRIEGIERDMATLAEHPLPADGYIGIELLGQHFDERKKAGIVLLNECKQAKVFTSTPVGKYRGLEVLVKKHNLLSEVQIVLKGAVEYTFTASDSDIGNITRIDNALERLPEELSKAQASLENVKQQFESAKQAVGKPFPQEQELKDKLARIVELDIALKMVDEPAAQTGNLIKAEAVSDENYMSI